jgi:hypothetical protein
MMSLFKSNKSIDISDAEVADLERLEAKISSGLRAYAAAGEALAEIQERRLWRVSHQTWEMYLSDRWRMSGTYATKLMEAMRMAKDLAAMGLAPPARESHARELQRVVPEKQHEVWKEVLERVGGDPEAVTAEQIADAAGARRRTRKMRVKKPKSITLRGKGWNLVLSRRTANVDPIAALAEALEQLEAKAGTKRAA